MTVKFNKLDAEVQRAKDRGLDLDGLSDVSLLQRFEEMRRCGNVIKLSMSCKRRLVELGYMEKYGSRFQLPGVFPRGRQRKHTGEVNHGE